MRAALSLGSYPVTWSAHALCPAQAASGRHATLCGTEASAPSAGPLYSSRRPVRGHSPCLPCHEEARGGCPWVPGSVCSHVLYWPKPRDDPHAHKGGTGTWRGVTQHIACSCEIQCHGCVCRRRPSSRCGGETAGRHAARRRLSVVSHRAEGGSVVWGDQNVLMGVSGEPGTRNRLRPEQQVPLVGRQGRRGRGCGREHPVRLQGPRCGQGASGWEAVSAHPRSELQGFHACGVLFAG